MLTQVYDATTLQLTAQLRDSVPTLVQQREVPTISFRAPEIGVK